MTVQSRSESAFAVSTLPAGRAASENVLPCFSRVYDALGAMSSFDMHVTVSKLELSSNELYVLTVDSMSAAAGNVASIKQEVGLLSSVINTVDCSAAPNCATIGRKDCDIVENTCGECKTDFVGSSGYDNSPCIPVSDIDMLHIGEVQCSEDAECNAWSTCAAGMCTFVNKRCPNNCSEAGDCIFFNRNTAKPVATCLLIDETCEALCECRSGFFGTSCDLTAEEARVKQSIRDELVNSLVSAVGSDDSTSESIQSWIGGAAGLISHPDEVSTAGHSSASNLVRSVLKANQFVTGELLDETLGVLSNLMHAGEVETRRRLLGSQEAKRETIDLIDGASTLLAKGMVSGQYIKGVITPMFRVAAQIISSTQEDVTHVSIPQTELERANGILSPSISINTTVTSGDVSAAIMALKARFYPEELQSNAIRVRLTSGAEDGPGKFEMDIDLITNELQNYLVVNHNVTHNTTCASGDFSSHIYTCPSFSGSAKLINHTCNGTAAVFFTRCPDEHQLPTCRILDGSNVDCFAVRYTAKSTTCRCRIRLSSRRRLSGDLENSGMLEVASLTVLVADEFVTTIASTEDFDSLEDVRTVLTVILMYGCLWAGGILGIMLCGVRHKASNKVKSSESDLERKKEDARQMRTTAAVKEYLTAYVNEVFPTVFRADSSILRLYHEICKHHRYLILFTAKGPNSESVRMITGVHLLTIQTMLMFMLAVLYDMQVK